MGLYEEDILTAASELLEKILDLLPLSGILTSWWVKWNKGSASNH